MHIEKLNSLLDKIIENRFKDTALQVKMCDELYLLASNAKDEEKMGVALYYKSEALYGSEPIVAEECANRSIQLLSNEKNPEILARDYNMLGIIANSREDMAIALDCYLSCNKVCQRHKLYHIRGLSACNIAVIFQLMEAYDKAIQYFKLAISCFEQEADNDYSRENIVTCNTNIFICCFKTDNIDGARKCIENIRNNRECVDPPFVADLMEAEMSYLDGDLAGMKKQVLVALEGALTQANAIDYMDFYQLFCEFLFKQKMYDLMIQLLDVIESKMERNSFPRIRIDFIKYRLTYLEEINDMDEYTKWSKEYIRTFELINDNYHQSVLDSVNLRLYVEELKIAESELEIKTMTDNLTQIYNRTGFHHFAEHLFEMALMGKENISFSIIDIDYFKQINDTYGHGYGDVCLQKIAGILSEFQSDNIVVARYGGDEFVMFTYGKSIEEVRKIAITIKTKVDELNIEAKNSLASDHVTLSQGICFGIPDDEETILDFLHRADEVLYDVKENGRDGFEINK